MQLLLPLQIPQGYHVAGNIPRITHIIIYVPPPPPSIKVPQGYHVAGNTPGITIYIDPLHISTLN